MRKYKQNQLNEILSKIKRESFISKGLCNKTGATGYEFEQVSMLISKEETLLWIGLHGKTDSIFDMCSVEDGMDTIIVNQLKGCSL